MDYEKKYKDAVSKIKSIIADKKKQGLTNCLFEGDLNEIFIELTESEDERIKRAIKHQIERLDDEGWSGIDGIKYADMLAWLEKQGEQKHVDKIESKFKIGDWIVSPGGCYLHILDIEEDGYLCEDILGEETKVLCEHPNCGCKLWTIEDAKDGDVLAAHECYVIFKKIDGLNIKCYCTYHYLGFNLSFYVDTLQNKNAFHPATKEQRDLLFQKIKEAGYEWNDNEKVLVGFDNDDEQHEELEDDETDLNIKQNPSWSEEDEKRCMWIVRLIGTARFSEIESDRMPCDRNELIKWLKSLKPQPHWKPTDEQMEDLKYAINMVDKCCEDSLQSLYNDLKKL